ncbi:MAG: hypothetical protein O2779_03910 [Nanoarchaeota archaeon]|nr:hypothetical protein [Nanoarchaeota archaeon]
MRKIAIGLVVVAFVLSACGPNYDSFATCLTENDVTFYGAYWCPHCAAQKEMFKGSITLVDYVECSLPNRGGETEICAQEQIESYPTWEFADGGRVTGTQSFETLAAKSGCALP